MEFFINLWNTPNETLGGVLRIQPDSITLIVFGVCISLFILSCWDSNWSRKIRDIAPALMVSAGIIGTFWGTFLALGEFEGIGEGIGGSVFDSQRMLNSIPRVLDGMKTAFITSLIGLFFAFVAKIILRAMPDKPLPIEASTNELLEEIRDGIAEKDDKSLSSQIGALRNENAGGFKALDARMDGLAEAIRESLVKSLESLMSELREAIINQLTPQLEATNEMLREQLTDMLDRIEEALIKQFGETFKQFNEATQAIKKWQEDHRVQVEQLTEAFRTTAAGIENIRADCEKIPETMEQLRTLMGELDARLAAFADMKEKAEASFPLIKENLDSIGADMKNSAEGFAGLEKIITDIVGRVEKASQDMVAETHNASIQYQKEIRAVMKTVQEESHKCVEDTSENLRQMAEDHAQKTSDVLSEIARVWGENMTGIARQVAREIRQSRGQN